TPPRRTNSPRSLTPCPLLSKPALRYRQGFLQAAPYETQRGVLGMGLYVEAEITQQLQHWGVFREHLGVYFRVASLPRGAQQGQQQGRTEAASLPGFSYDQRKFAAVACR